MMSPFDWNGKAVQYGGGSTCWSSSGSRTRRTRRRSEIRLVRTAGDMAGRL